MAHEQTFDRECTLHAQIKLLPKYHQSRIQCQQRHSPTTVKGSIKFTLPIYKTVRSHRHWLKMMKNNWSYNYYMCSISFHILLIYRSRHQFKRVTMLNIQFAPPFINVRHCKRINSFILRLSCQAGTHSNAALSSISTVSIILKKCWYLVILLVYALDDLKTGIHGVVYRVPVILTQQFFLFPSLDLLFLYFLAMFFFFCWYIYLFLLTPFFI